MAYTKQTWTDDVSAVTGARMTHIEDGIYDNSTNIDTINNNVNPSGTATTTQTDFTEGQLTQKLGLKYIKMKGQTSQDSDPTPTNPVDVNNVTGSNVIKIGNKNLINKINFAPSGTYTDVTITNNNDGTLTLNGTTTANRSYYLSPSPYTFNEEEFDTYTYKCFGLPNTCYTNIYYGSNVYGENTYNLNVNTAGRNYAIILVIPSGVTLSNVQIKPMFIRGSYTSSNFPSFTAHKEEDYYIDLGTIELCKIGNYQDYFYKNNGKWYKYGAISKVVLNGTTNNITSKSGNTSNNTYISSVISDILAPTSNGAVIPLLCSHYTTSASTDYIVTHNTLGIAVRTDKKLAIGETLESTNTTVELMNTWLQTHNVSLYYPLATPTDTEITYEPLLRQLDKLDKIGLYNISNISQDNSDMKMLLDFTICNDNYNGLREFIRA